MTVETYQWFVRNAGNISDAYSIVICDEAHTALGEKTSAAIRAWTGPVFVGMTATGALIARHVTDLFPTQTSRFDLAQAARRGVISPLRCVRIPPGPGVRTIAKVPLRRGEVDTEFDQEMLAELLDQLPFNLAIADLYKTRFNGVPGVVYAAGVRHAYNVAQAFRDLGMKAQAVSGETPKRELAQILARYERGDIDVLVNAQLLAEGWNSPRATVCMHLAPTASKRIYQQRVGRVTRRHLGKEAGIVVDFVHPATKHDDPVVTLHSLLDRDVYRGGAIVVGPVRRGRGRRLRVERRVLPVTSEENRRIEVFERELWRIAVEHLDYGEQVQWAALAGARVAPTGWRRARAMLHFDQGGELKRTFLITAVDRNKNPQLRLRALQEIASGRDAEAFDRALDFVESWPRDDKREGVKVVLQALAEKKIGRRDQANNWIWRCANMTREVHEEYAVQRWPETKRLLGPAGELVRRGARAQRAPARAPGAAAGPAAVAPRCWPPRSRTPPRRARSSTAPARGCPASPPRWRASCCATSRRAAARPSAAAAARAPGRRIAPEARAGRRGDNGAVLDDDWTGLEGAEVENEGEDGDRGRRRRARAGRAAASRSTPTRRPRRHRGAAARAAARRRPAAPRRGRRGRVGRTRGRAAEPARSRRRTPRGSRANAGRGRGGDRGRGRRGVAASRPRSAGRGVEVAAAPRRPRAARRAARASPPRRRRSRSSRSPPRSPRARARKPRPPQTPSRPRRKRAPRRSAQPRRRARPGGEAGAPKRAAPCRDGRSRRARRRGPATAASREARAAAPRGTQAPRASRRRQGQAQADGRGEGARAERRHAQAEGRRRSRRRPATKAAAKPKAAARSRRPTRQAARPRRSRQAKAKRASRRPRQAQAAPSRRAKPKASPRPAQATPTRRERRSPRAAVEDAAA